MDGESVGHNRIKVVGDASYALPNLIEPILDIADSWGWVGCVAYHFVGAVLATRFRAFPTITIATRPCSSRKSEWSRDYLVGDTAFHVVTDNFTSSMKVCENDIAEGFRAYMLVRLNHIETAHQSASKTGLNRSIYIQSIESFCAVSILNRTNYTSAGIDDAMRDVLLAYNQRISSVEHDSRLLIDIPHWL